MKIRLALAIPVLASLVIGCDSPSTTPAAPTTTGAGAGAAPPPTPAPAVKRPMATGNGALKPSSP